MAPNSGSAQNTLRDVAALILRVVTGVIFVAHGAQKLGLIPSPVPGAGGVAGTVAIMGHMGIPFYLAYCNIAAEFAGGLGLIGGFLTRLSSFGILVSMLVAIFAVHLHNGIFLPRGYEHALALAAVALYFLAVGGGPYSIDRFVRFRPKRA